MAETRLEIALGTNSDELLDQASAVFGALGVDVYHKTDLENETLVYSAPGALGAYAIIGFSTESGSNNLEKHYRSADCTLNLWRLPSGIIKVSSYKKASPEIPGPTKVNNQRELARLLSQGLHPVYEAAARQHRWASRRLAA